MAPRPSSARLLWVAAGFALLVAALLLLAPQGYTPTSAPDSEASQAPPTTTAPAPVSAASASETAIAAAAPEETPGSELHGDEDVASSITPPQWSPEAAAAAEDAAAAVLAAWLSAQPYDQWWAQLEPLMNISGAQIYERVDPTEIAPATIQGAAIAQETTTGYLVEVTVPTSQGEYVVVLTRDAEGAPWLAERLVLPSTETAS